MFYEEKKKNKRIFQFTQKSLIKVSELTTKFVFKLLSRFFYCLVNNVETFLAVNSCWLRINTNHIICV